ncbi:hypothetical protein D3C76_1274050 [compost metagenome]
MIAKRKAISPDGIEGDVSQIQQACQANDDVQPQPQQHIDQAEDRHGQHIFGGYEGETDSQREHQRNDPAQGILVIRIPYIDPRVVRLKTGEQANACGRGQEGAHQETAGHDGQDDPRQPLPGEIEAVAIQHHADDGAEDDQRHQPGENRIQQAALEGETVLQSRL